MFAAIGDGVGNHKLVSCGSPLGFGDPRLKFSAPQGRVRTQPCLASAGAGVKPVLP